MARISYSSVDLNDFVYSIDEVPTFDIREALSEEMKEVLAGDEEITIEGLYDDEDEDDDMIVDFGQLNSRLDQAVGGVVARDVRITHSYDRLSEIDISGYWVPTREGGFKLSGRRTCHLCEAPLVNEKSEVQAFYDEEGERHEKYLLVQTYECGTSVERESGKRANVVKLGLQCIQLPTPTE